MGLLSRFHYLVIIVFLTHLPFYLIGQHVGSEIEEISINQQLLNDSISSSSRMIRTVAKPSFYLDTHTQHTFIVKPIHTLYQFQYVQLHPYNWNDGALLPLSGNQQLISAGFQGKFKSFEFRLAPELVLAQNTPYEGFPTDHDPVTWRDFYRYNNYIETPERFGIFPVRKLYGGQSFLRYSYKKISIEASTANKWWGPGQRNALLLSNNAPGLPHLSLRTNQPLQTRFGSFDFEFLYGLNFNAPFPPADSTKVFRYYKLYVPKEDVQRITKGFILAWNPKWVKGLSIGIAQMDIRYVYQTRRFSQWLPFHKPFKRINLDDHNNSLQIGNAFINYRIPNYQMDIYAEFGWNNPNRNFRDVVLNPERGMASVMGFKKLFSMPSGHYWEVNAELTNLQTQMIQDVFVNAEPKSWYLHPNIRQGYTHAGQILGAGTGPGGASQYLELNWRKKMKRIGFSLERKANNNDFYVYTFTNSFDFRRFWIDFAATLKVDWKIGPLLVGARFSSIHSNNYQWWLYTPGTFYFVRGRDVNRFSGQLHLTYLFPGS